MRRDAWRQSDARRSQARQLPQGLQGGLLEHQGSEGPEGRERSRNPGAAGSSRARKARKGPLARRATRATPGLPGLSVPSVAVTDVTGRDSSTCAPQFWANDVYTLDPSVHPAKPMGRSRSFGSYDGTFTTIAGVSQPQPVGGCPGPPQTGGVTGTFKGFDVVARDGRRVHSGRDLSRSSDHSGDARDILPSEGWPSGVVVRRPVRVSVRRRCSTASGLTARWREAGTSAISPAKVQKGRA